MGEGDTWGARAEVGDPLRVSRRSEVEIDPAEQELLRWELEQILERLARLEEPDHLGVCLEVDRREQCHLNHLPDQAEHKVGAPLDHVLRADVDDGETDRLSGGEYEVLVLDEVEGRTRAKVDRALVDRLGHRHVEQLAQERAVGDGREEVADLGNRQDVREVGVVSELAVDEFDECGALLLVERVDDVVLAHLHAAAGVKGWRGRGVAISRRISIDRSARRGVTPSPLISPPARSSSLAG